MLRPFLEKLATAPDASWSMLNRRLSDAIPFQWHHHPEFELTLTLNSRGQRFVADHVGLYEDEDLVLVGPNLPHTWSSSDKLDPDLPHVALVLWFRQEWLARLVEGSIELEAVRSLLERGAGGLQFSRAAARSVRPQIESLFGLSPEERLFVLLRILCRLGGDTAALPLSALNAARSGQGESRERIDRVLTHIHQNYAKEIHLVDLAELAALSLSGLHRMFLKHTRTGVSDYLIRLRIGDACSRLSGTNHPVQHIADAVGYRSLANFNRHFRRLRAMTPREYRDRFRLRPEPPVSGGARG